MKFYAFSTVTNRGLESLPPQGLSEIVNGRVSDVK